MRLQTFSGGTIAPHRPTAGDIAIEDIAHALSMLCRFGGHVRTFYSVAQHSVLASRCVPREDALWALLHDASEAYLVDVPTPVKTLAALNGYRAIEALLQKTIYQTFGLMGNEPDSVRQADQALVLLEADTLLTGGAGAAFDEIRQTVPPAEVRIVPVEPAVAERAFLKRFHELKGMAPRG